MQTNKKVLISFIIFGVIFVSINVSYASYNWKDYFSFGQKSSIGNVANSAVLNGLKSNDDWKNAIRRKNIAEGAITNEKIASDAAVAGTKINPNFGSQNIITTGSIGIGTDDPSKKLTVLGDAYFSDHMGVGTAVLSNVGLGAEIEASIGEAKTAIYASGQNVDGSNATWIRGVMGEAWATAGGTIDSASGLETNIGTSEGSTITNGYGVYINEILSGVTNKFGLYQAGDGDINYFAGDVGIGTTDPTEKLDINSDNIRIRTDKTPANATVACDKGEMSWDSDYVYVCVATNTWKRSALTTW